MLFSIISCYPKLGTLELLISVGYLSFGLTISISLNIVYNLTHNSRAFLSKILEVDSRHVVMQRVKAALPLRVFYGYCYVEPITIVHYFEKILENTISLVLAFPAKTWT